MVYIPNLHYDKQRLLALLTADLTSAQLDRIQELFGIGATSRSPYPAEELFIEDKREWSHLSHADLMRAYPEQDPLLVIDSHTPHDGGIWYIEGFATADDVTNGLAESLNTLYKIRMDIRDVVMQFTSYSVANTHISNDLWHVNAPMWTRVVEKGGSPFVGKVAELYYTTNFDIMAYFLLRLEKGDRDAIASIQYAHENLQRGEEAEYWGIEHSWKLSPQQHVDKIFVYAKFCRLWGVPTLIPVAVGMIDQLVDLSPSEPVILDEKRKIEAWKRSAGPVDESAFNAAMNGLEL
ncbi:hypothetical protein GT037_006432 [Alternaria burnsii]|uniref:Uncharacterized protein n=1 Tax=Alternaria burnsii TaxID=1187904 RepID=A0A8H7BAK2_9PLEO|nr:uncharacterized protein GT037_006432 [Alternaria burnsii]KAF7675713.1 hypothetical protein GT037_006432 [Alternaria burnsii]